MLIISFSSEPRRFDDGPRRRDSPLTVAASFITAAIRIGDSSIWRTAALWAMDGFRPHDLLGEMIGIWKAAADGRLRRSDR